MKKSPVRLERPGRAERSESADTPPCDLCGSPDTVWIKCKLVCRNCHAILLTCGDL